MSTEIQDIFNVLRKHLSDLKSNYDIHTLEVFGSYVREEHTSASDLDLLVSFNEEPGLIKFIELENRLSDLLGIKVDLVMKDSLRPEIGKEILSEALTV